MKIAEALARAALDAKMTDTQIAAAIGVSADTVTHWRRGRKSPRGQHLIALVKLLPGFGKLVGLGREAVA